MVPSDVSVRRRCMAGLTGRNLQVGGWDPDNIETLSFAKKEGFSNKSNDDHGAIAAAVHSVAAVGAVQSLSPIKHLTSSSLLIK
eukprot:SAG11_NODE_4216_length_2008_cov_2.993190_1_plen_84_part_00